MVPTVQGPLNEKDYLPSKHPPFSSGLGTG